MLTQRISSSAVCGYSSLSIMFLSKHSAISFSACGSIHVVTKVARFIRAFPSSISSSWIDLVRDVGRHLVLGHLVSRDPVPLELENGQDGDRFCSASAGALDA